MIAREAVEPARRAPEQGLDRGVDGGRLAAAVVRVVLDDAVARGARRGRAADAALEGSLR